MKSGSTILIIAAAAGAYLLFSRKKGQGEGGTGGSLDLPFSPTPSENITPTMPNTFSPGNTILQQPSISQKKTVGGSSVSSAFFNASTTPTYGANQSRGDTFSSNNPNSIARAAENKAYSNTNYGQLGASVFGSQYSGSSSSSSKKVTTPQQTYSSDSGGSSTLHARMGVA